MESLPALLRVLDEFEVAIALVRTNPPQYVLDAFERLPVRPIFVNRPIHLDTFYLAGQGMDSGWPLPNDVARLRQYFVNEFANTETGNKFIYISRRFSQRSHPNEIELEQALKDYGFKTLYLEELSWSDQLEAFATAEIIVAQHGAGLANLVFCSHPKKVKVIELMPTTWANPCFAVLAQILDMVYSTIIYDPEDSTAQTIIQKVQTQLEYPPAAD
jgi:hypothetical protein